jgi:hypothetical protein
LESNSVCFEYLPSTGDIALRLKLDIIKKQR